MQILFGTTNESKLRSVRRVTEALGIGLIGLSDLRLPLPRIEETGRDIRINAALKASAYWQAFRVPVFSCDSGLYFEGVDASLQPGTHVRRVNGKDLTDEEMIAYYAGLARAHGGTLTARYRTAVCLVADGKTVLERADDTLASEPFLLADTPHPKREKGYPLDSLSKEIRSGRYYYDLPEASFEDNTVDRGFYAFFRDALQLLK